MLDSGDSEVFWLNVTNISLGLAVLGLLGAVLVAAVLDVWSAAQIRLNAAHRDLSGAASDKGE